MKEIYICKDCGFISTLRNEFVKLDADEFKLEYFYQCKECNAEALAKLSVGVLNERLD